MLAFLDDIAFVEDQDPVRVADGRQPVGDDKARAALHQRFHRLLDGHLGAGIDRARRLVQCALGESACRQGFQVRDYRTSRLLHEIMLSHADGSFPKLLNTLARLPLLILDDWLRDSLSAGQARDLLDIIDDRYGRASTLVASQVPVEDLHARFPDPTLGDAVLDRLIHNAYGLELRGESMRKSHSALPLVMG